MRKLKINIFFKKLKLRKQEGMHRQMRGKTITQVREKYADVSIQVQVQLLITGKESGQEQTLRGYIITR